MAWREHIVSNPDILVGKPSIKGTRISVEPILGWLANGWTHEMILESYPQLAREDIVAAVAIASPANTPAPGSDAPPRSR